MPKIIKMLFSRLAIVMLMILFQAAAYIILWTYLSYAYLYIHTFFSFISILILLLVINKQEPASYKLPWIFILLVMPFYGVIIYSLFGRIPISKKYIRKYKGIYEESIDYQAENEELKQIIKDHDVLASSQSEYIFNTTKLPLYKNSKVTYFSMGEPFFISLLEKIKNAKKFIFLEYFIIEKGYMWDTLLEVLKTKVSEGVEVYLIYDDIGCITKLPYRYYTKLNSFGIKCVVFNPFMPIVSAIHNNRDHRKIAVIDGLYAYTGGINLADEYINAVNPYGKWKDSSVLIEGEAVKSFMIMFLQTYNAHAKEKLDYKKYMDEVKKVESDGIVQPFATGPKPFFKDRVGENVYLNIINQAKRYVYINTPYLITDYHFTEAIKNACKRGVDIKIMTPHIPDKKTIYFMTKSNYSDLIKAGVKIYEYSPGFIHSKSFVCDDEIGVVGTINLDYRSFVHHFECGIWMYKNECINELKKDFIDTCENEGLLIEKDNANLKAYQRLLKNILEIFAPML